MSRKKRAIFMNVTAKCLDGQCPRFYRFMIGSNGPTSSGDVFIKVVTFNEIRHIEQTKMIRRKLTGELYHQIGKKAAEIGPLNYSNQAVNEFGDICASSDNYSSMPTTEALKSASHRMKKKTYLDQDTQTELKLAQNLYLTGDTESIVIKGHIQYLSSSPFTVVCYNEKHLPFYLNYRQASNNLCVLHLDATGNVEKLEGGLVKPYHYSMTFSKGQYQFTYRRSTKNASYLAFSTLQLTTTEPYLS
jgi:hypothetical protein